jgi:antirestriction protein ArdC
MQNKIKNKVYESIMNALDKGVVPWRKPWSAVNNGRAYNGITGRPYKGINVVLLAAAEMSEGFTTNAWATFNQINKAGGHVRKGEKCKAFVVFWSRVEKKNVEEDSDEDENFYWLLKIHNVFNLSQTAGLEHLIEEAEVKALVPDSEKVVDALAAFDKYTNREGLTVKENGGEAYYSITGDYIGMPKKETFDSGEDYVSTAFHEAVHSTGAKKRLDRPMKGYSNIDNHSYSYEELIAEFGAAFTCAHFGIDNTIENSAAYIESCKRTIDENKHSIMSAASAAQKAVEFILK